MQDEIEPAIERMGELLREAGLIDADVEPEPDEFVPIEREDSAQEFRLAIHRPAPDTVSVVVATDATLPEEEIEEILPQIEMILEESGQFEPLDVTSGLPGAPGVADTAHLALSFHILDEDLIG